MDNEKRVLLAIILSIVVLFGYQSFFSPPPPKSAPQDQQQQQSIDAPAELPVPRLQPPAPSMKIEKLAEPVEQVTDSYDSPVTITTNLFTAVFSSSRARLKSFQLHQYKDSIKSPALIQKIQQMFSSDTAELQQPRDISFKELIHVLQPVNLPLRAAFIDASGSMGTLGAWQADKESLAITGSNSNSLTFTQTDSSGLQMQKQFVFSPDTYAIDLNITITNTAAAGREGSPFLEWTTPCPDTNGGGLFGGGTQDIPKFSYLIKDSVEEKDLAKIEDPETYDASDILWTAIEEKYFTAAIVPTGDKPQQIRLTSDKRLVAYQLLFPYIALPPGAQKTYTFSLYFGPKDIDILNQQGHKLVKTVDFGFFDIIAKPMLLSLKFFYGFLGNYGLAIIIMTILIKLILWPLTNKSMQSMKGMQKIQPEVAELKEKYKDNKEEFTRQQLELYKKYKVNPFGGCLPILLQIPVFISFYRALMDSIELRHASFISFWINDLSAKDPTYITPVIMGASMLLQQKMTPTTADPAQAKMFMFMPVIFTVMFLNFPSGLVLYWLVNNVLSIAQQVYINKKSHDAGGTEECSQSKSKPKRLKKRSQ
ncbi:membrane protein insertase YidC [Thermodesulfobacteriota bacterium]